MSGLDDLLKGIAVFKEGVSSYATSTAVNDANKQLQQLNATALDENERLQASNQIAQGLSMRLVQAGASPGAIQAATEQIAPSLGAQYQAQQNRELQQSSQQFQTNMAGTEMAFKSGMEALENTHKVQLAERENQWKVAAAEKLAALEREKIKATTDKDAKNTEKTRLKDMSTYLKGYQDTLIKGTAKENDALLSINTAKDALATNKPIGAELAQMTVIKALSGAQFTDKQMEMLGGSQAIADQTKQVIERMATGKMTPANRKWLGSALSIMEENTKGSIKNKAMLLAKQAHARAQKSGIDIQSPEEALGLIYPEDVLQAQSDMNSAVNSAGIAKNPNKPAGGFSEPQAAPAPAPKAPSAPQGSFQAGLQNLLKSDPKARIQQSPDGKKIKVIWSDGKSDILDRAEVGE